SPIAGPTTASILEGSWHGELRIVSPDLLTGSPSHRGGGTRRRSALRPPRGSEWRDGPQREGPRGARRGAGVASARHAPHGRRRDRPAPRGWAPGWSGAAPASSP